MTHMIMIIATFNCDRTVKFECECEIHRKNALSTWWRTGFRVE